MYDASIFTKVTIHARVPRNQTIEGRANIEMIDRNYFIFSVDFDGSIRALQPFRNNLKFFKLFSESNNFLVLGEVRDETLGFYDKEPNY